MRRFDWLRQIKFIYAMFYCRGLKEWNREKGYLTDTCLLAQDNLRGIWIISESVTAIENLIKNKKRRQVLHLSSFTFKLGTNRSPFYVSPYGRLLSAEAFRAEAVAFFLLMRCSKKEVHRVPQP